MTDTAFEREKWEAEHRLREREVALQERDLAAREQEAASKSRQAAWTNPLVIAVLAAALAAAGNATVALINGSLQLRLEETKAEAARILEVIKTGDPDKAAENLDFLLKAGLIADEARRADLERFLNQRQPGQGPSIPAQTADAPRFLTMQERNDLLGGPDIQQSDVGNPVISLDDPWYKANLVTVDIPQLRNVPTLGGGTSNGQIRFHRAAAPALQAVFAEIEAQGLLGDIRTFDGAFVPRTVRGPLRRLSAHALGIAIDLNSSWNRYGQPPVADGAEGSLARVVPIFERHGFAWGGRTGPLADPGHFEFADRDALKGP
ncbi:M15 family metallopeptidase [Inquilinus sp. YAF38]|uniref:M15 family metallopeptidase n=1 Tax=Inquilinus sp. YAF38 TaxID=3233084 RepID=UPI003F8DFDDE